MMHKCITHNHVSPPYCYLENLLDGNELGSHCS